MKSEIFDTSWEKNYAKGKMLNRYPFDIVISLTFNYFGGVADKSAVKVLDLGCGAGNNSLFFAREGFDVTGIDASVSAVEVAKQRFESEGLKGRILHMDLGGIDALDETYDLILDRSTLNTIAADDLQALLPKIADRMHENSVFFSFFYNQEHPDIIHCKTTADDITFYDLENGAFSGASRVCLLRENDVRDVFSAFEIKGLYNHKIEPLIESGTGFGGIAEYIIICGKK